MERYKFKQPAISDTLADFFSYVKNLVLSKSLNRKKLSMYFKSSPMIHTFKTYGFNQLYYGKTCLIAVNIDSNLIHHNRKKS